MCRGALTGLSRWTGYRHGLVVVSSISVRASVTWIPWRLESQWAEALC